MNKRNNANVVHSIHFHARFSSTEVRGGSSGNVNTSRSWIPHGREYLT